MPAMAGVCPGCGVFFESVNCHQAAARCFPRLLGPRAAWRQMLDADQRVFAARGLDEYQAAELEARGARAEFAEALRRCA